MDSVKDDDEFYLLDLRYKPREAEDGGDEGEHVRPFTFTTHGAPLMVWWGPKDNGYGNSLAAPWVGRYTAKRIREAIDYYRPGTNTLAIPCAAAEALAVPRPAVFMGRPGTWCDGPGPIVINHSLMWDLLEAVAWMPEAPDV